MSKMITIDKENFDMMNQLDISCNTGKNDCYWDWLVHETEDSGALLPIHVLCHANDPISTTTSKSIQHTDIAIIIIIVTELAYLPKPSLGRSVWPFNFCTSLALLRRIDARSFENDPLRFSFPLCCRHHERGGEKTRECELDGQREHRFHPGRTEPQVFSEVATGTGALA